MATILDIYAKTPPKTSMANVKGVDTTPIGTDNPRGESTPSKNLAKDEKRLFKARGGVLKSGKYTDTVIKK
jgi:hypothetical protein